MLGFSSIGQSLISWFLRKFLDKYVEDIETRIKGFQYGLSGGTLVLDNLNLRAEALVGLDLPIEVKAGHIGLLEVRLPALNRIQTDSLIVTVENVFLLASPTCDRKYDEKKDEAIRQAHKREVLDKLEQLLQQESAEQEEGDRQDPGFLDRIKVTVLQNIQVQIKDIHIRYEDDVTNQSSPFAFGITLQELSLKPSSSNQDSSSLKYVNKLLKLEELAVYWNRLESKEQMLKDDLTDWKSAMANSIDVNSLHGVMFDHLIAPINGSAQLVINLQEKTKDPVIACTGCFEHININFKRHMFLNAIVLKDSFAMMRVNERYRKFHPGVPCRGNSRQWWKYAYDSMVLEVVKPKREFWERVWDYRRKYKSYRDLYTLKLLSPGKYDEKQVDELEMELNIESIVMARKEAEKMYLTQKPDMAVEKPANEGMVARFSNWWYGDDSSAKEVVVHAKRPPPDDNWWAGLSEEEKKELYEAFDYSQDQPVDASNNAAYVKYKLDVKFEGIQFNLLMNAMKGEIHVATLYIADIEGHLAVRTQGLKFHSTVKYLEIYQSTDPTDRKFLAKVDTSSPVDSSCAVDPSPGAEDSTDSATLLSVVVEQYPTDVDADISLRVKTLPLRLVYDHTVVCAAMAFFYIPVEKYSIAAKLRSFSPEFSTAGLQYAIDKHQRIYVEATICSPHLIIPSKGLFSSKASQIIVDLGVLKVGTELRPKELRLEDNSLAAREQAIYDKYSLHLSDVKILYATKGIGLKEMREKRHLPDSDIHVMPSLCLTSVISISAEPNFKQLPQFKVDSCLDRLQLKISTTVLESLLKMLYTFPFPSAQECFDQYGFDQPEKKLEEGGAALDMVDNAIATAGMGNLMRSELNRNNSLVDAIDFERIQRLEDRNIFVTQGDLLNLWFLLSKDTGVKRKRDDKSETDGGKTANAKGLNDVADLLLQPDAMRVHDFGARRRRDDDDNEFVLAEETCPRVRLELPGLHSYTGDEFCTLLHTTFTIKEVSVKLLSERRDYLSAVITGVTGKACKTNCCVSISLQMNHVELTDDLHLDSKHETLHIINSSELESMASFEGRFIDDVTHVKFTRIANAITFNLGTIQMCIHDESTKMIMQQVAKISNVLRVLQMANEPRNLPTPKDTASVSSLRTAYTERDVFYDAVSKLDSASLMSRRSLQSVDSTSRPRNAKRKNTVSAEPAVDVIDLDIRCCLKSIKLDLQRRFEVIAKLDLSDVSAEYEMKKTHWSVGGKLGAISIIDPKATIYKQVLVVEEGLKEIITFHFTSFNQSVQRNEACDQEATIKLRRIRLIFINQFISRLTKYFGQFSSPGVEMVHEKSKQKITSTAQSAHQAGTTTLLHVEVKAPVITVPENGQSNNALLFQLGDLHASNTFVTEEISTQTVTTHQVYDQMSITLENLAIDRITYVNELKYLGVRHLLTPVTTEVVIRRALTPVAKTAVDLDIKANINQFKIEASQLDMQLFGTVLYQNVLVEDKTAAEYDVTDVGSTISSALSSTGSSSSSHAKALTVNLGLGGLLLHLKREDPSSNVLQNVTTDLAVMDIAELKVDFCQGKKDSAMSCLVTLSNFTVVDHVVAVEEYSTNRIIQLDDNANQVLLVKYNMNADGDSNVFCAVEKLRFNVNLPFVKGMLTFLQESFTTWKAEEPARPAVQGRRRGRKLNTAAVGRRVSKISAPKSEFLGETKNTTMVIDLKLDKQSLYVITADGSQKALVAEMNLVGKAVIASTGRQEADIQLTDMTVYTTSLDSDKSHLKHQCLQPCDIHVKYSSVNPLPQFRGTAPPKVDVSITLSKVDIKLSTNFVYHALDAMALLKGEDTTDNVAVEGFQSNEADLNEMKDIDRAQWLEQYDISEDHAEVEMNPMKAAIESMTLSDFKLDVEFAVAIGEEFVPILRTQSNLSASVKDWSTQMRAECCFTLDCNYYNELLDVWEPLVECMFDEVTGQYRRWEILARLTTATSHPIAKTNPTEILVDSQELDTYIHHQMSSAKERQKQQELAAEDAVSTDDQVDGRSAAASEDYTHAAAGTQAKVTSYRDDAIIEEDEEEEHDCERRPMLASAGVPTLVVTQPSTEEITGNIGGQPVLTDPVEELDEVDAVLDEIAAREEVLCTYISLVSRDKLLLNVTAQGLGVVTSVIDTFTKKPSDSTLFEVAKSHPLTITNELGTLVSVCLHKTTRQLDAELEHVTMDNNMEVRESDISAQQPTGSLALDKDPSDHAVRTFVGLTSPVATVHVNYNPSGIKATLRKQQLHLAIDGYHPIPHVSFRRTQSRDFSARPVNQTEPHLCVRVKTQSKHGRRHVRIFSPLAIRNQLNCPVQVSYQELTHDVEHSRHTTSNQSLGTIEPDGVLHVPSVVALQKKLQVKPLTAASTTLSASEFGGSNESLWWRDHLKTKSAGRSIVLRRANPTSTQLLTCSNLLQDTFTFKAVWISHTCQADKCNGVCPAFDVSLETAVEVRNFLPFPVSFDVHVAASTGPKTSHYNLEPGENVQVTDSTSISRRCHLIIPDYQGMEWRGHLDVHDKMAEARAVPLILTSTESLNPAKGKDTEPSPASLIVSANVSRAAGYKGSQGQLHVTFFSAYWISNTTGLTLQFKASGLGSQQFESSDPYPVLFMTSTLKNKLLLRVPGCKWSKAFAVDAAGTVGSVSSLSNDRLHKHRFMVETHLSNTQLTKIINIFPMFVVLNKMEETLMFREAQAGDTDKDVKWDKAAERKSVEDLEDDGNGAIAMLSLANSCWTAIAHGQVMAFWPTSRVKPLSMVVKREGKEESTCAFPASTPQHTLLPIANQAAITADVSGGLGTEYFITLRQYQLGDCVVRIENLTKYTLQFLQGSQSKSDIVTVEGCKSWLYYWPNPQRERKLFWTVNNIKRKPILAKYTQDACGVLEHQGMRIYWQSYGDKLQRVLTFSESVQFQQIISKKNHKEQCTMFMFMALESASLSMINKNSLEVALLSINQSPAKWYVKPDGNDNWLPLGSKLSAVVEKAYCDPNQETLDLHHRTSHLMIDFNELRFVQPIQGVLRRDSFPGIKFQYQKSDLSMVVQASINHMQLDNQLPDAFYPVAFHPLTEVKSSCKPCMQMFVRRHFPLDGCTDAFKEASQLADCVVQTVRAEVNLEPAALRVDKGFMLSLLDFITDCRKTDDVDPDKLMKTYHEQDIEYCLKDLSADTILKTDKSSGAKIYVEQLRFSNISIKLSFSMAGKAHLTNVENTQSTFGGDVVDFLLGSIGMTLTEVTDIDFSLGEFAMMCAVLTTDQLTSDLLTFYKTQAISQAYVFVLGLDIIGNPLGLAKDVQKGLKDFFSSADPLNFDKESKKSLTQGIKSAYANIVGGMCGTGSKITESFGRGINVLTFDKSFQRARSRRVKSQPLHLAESLLLSGKTFGYALGSGLTGIVTQPKRGVEKQGAAGFFKGVGKGVTGVLIKPAGGVFDSVSVLLDGFRRATHSDVKPVERIRLPRHTIPSEGVTRYHPYLAEGVNILHTMGSYTYSADDVYWSHLTLKMDKKTYTALATTKTVYLLYVPWYTSLYRVIWSIPVDELYKPTNANGAITLKRVAHDEEHVLESDDHEILGWFNKRLNALLRYSKATYKTT